MGGNLVCPSGGFRAAKCTSQTGATITDGSGCERATATTACSCRLGKRRHVVDFMSFSWTWLGICRGNITGILAPKEGGFAAEKPRAQPARTPVVYPIFTFRWLAIHAIAVPTVFFLGAISAMQFIQR